MTHRSWRPLAAAGAAVVALGALGAGAPALADTAPKVVTSTAPMVSKGYDAKVAEAHGFKIVTAADGTQSSVPVTDDAKALVAASKPTGVHVLNTVSGDCGSSTVTAYYTSPAKVTVFTSYKVRLTSVSQNWHVNAVPAATGKIAHVFNFSGLNSSPSWTGQPQTATIAYSGSGGDAQVTLGSYAILVDGDVCYSGGPFDTW
ncbi:hypothetical protein [Curtobacterium pusillum]|uniref:hypothetical protein n=1 Tax=Curtobacterium pusillum TaxID=69373 RepID=UPI0011A9F19C|nr:hypothetical protein [Curtobacterium pusillum]